VFCAILDSLKAEFHELPTLPVLHKFIKKICDEIVSGHFDDTIFNFLLGCGQYTMFAYSWPGSRPNSKVWNGLWYIVRQPPFHAANLIDCDYSIDFSRVTTTDDRVAVIATKPLTNELEWKEFKRGELIMFDHGIPYSDPNLCGIVEKQGRGLQSKVFPKSPLLGSSKFEMNHIPELTL
jgi:predicted glutamine amidotransferase